VAGCLTSPPPQGREFGKSAVFVCRHRARPLQKGMHLKFFSRCLLLAVVALLSVGGSLAQELELTAEQTAQIAAIRQKAAQGDAKSQHSIGMLIVASIEEGTLKDAIEWFRKSAHQGNADAQLALGDLYSQGDGLVKNDIEGYKWCLLAASQGLERGRQSVKAVETRLSPEQRAEGQRLAAEWQAAFEKRQAAKK